MPQFTIAQKIFVYQYRKQGGLVCKIGEASVTRVIPNYLGKYGLHYGITGRSGIEFAYEPHKVFATREAAAAALREAVQADIAKLEAALAAID